MNRCEHVQDVEVELGSTYHEAREAKPARSAHLKWLYPSDSDADGYQSL